MKQNERQKICSHCDGRIAIEADTCPYCGIPLTPQEISSAHSSTPDALYTPPYSTRNAAFMKTEKEMPQKFKAPLKREHASENQLAGAIGKMPYPVSNSDESKVVDSGSFLPLLFVLLGANLLTVGLMQCFFSDDGFLRLEWNSKYWFLYCLVAVPLIYLGMKKTKQLGESS